MNVSWTMGSGPPHDSHCAGYSDHTGNQEALSPGLLRASSDSDGRIRVPTARLSTPAGVLTGLGGSLWLRALWMLPISVCELEWDRPSKYGLGGGDRERVVLWHTPHGARQGQAQSRPHPRGPQHRQGHLGPESRSADLRPEAPTPGGWPGAPDTWRTDGWGT